MDAKLCPDDQMATLLLDAPGTDASSVVPGTLIGERYVVQRPIGRGAFGAVWKAHDSKSNTSVALKLLHPRLLTHRRSLERRREHVPTAAVSSQRV